MECTPRNVPGLYVLGCTRLTFVFVAPMPASADGKVTITPKDFCMSCMSVVELFFSETISRADEVRRCVHVLPAVARAASPTHAPDSRGWHPEHRRSGSVTATRLM